MNRNHGEWFSGIFGVKTGKIITAAVAGSMMGVGEVALLPLDVLKIKAQTNPEALAGRGVVDIFRTEGRGLYRGAGWTAARNAPVSRKTERSFFPFLYRFCCCFFKQASSSALIV
jgi:hypothetical protein